MSSFATFVAALCVGVVGLAACSSGGEGSPTSSAAGSQTGSIALLSYNVAGLPQEISKETPGTNIPLISPKLAGHDLVLTQEDFDWWGNLASGSDFVNYHTRLRAEAGYPHMSPQHPGVEAAGVDVTSRQAPEVGDGLGVMSRLSLSGDDRIAWTGCFGGFDTGDGGAGDCLAMKGFQRTTVELADSVTVDVYNLHAEAGGTEKDQALQVDDFEQLADYIATHSKGRAIILAGDTNLHTNTDHPDSAEGADIDIWANFLEATGMTDVCVATSCAHPGRIDKAAFRSGGGVILTATGHRFLGDEFVDGSGKALSDHEPLRVTFDWKTTS